MATSKAEMEAHYRDIDAALDDDDYLPFADGEFLHQVAFLNNERRRIELINKAVALNEAQRLAEAE